MIIAARKRVSFGMHQQMYWELIVALIFEALKKGQTA